MRPRSRTYAAADVPGSDRAWKSSSANGTGLPKKKPCASSMPDGIAREFLAALSDGLPDCLILDLQMPDMTGLARSAI